MCQNAAELLDLCSSGPRRPFRLYMYFNNTMKRRNRTYVFLTPTMHGFNYA